LYFVLRRLHGLVSLISTEKLFQSLIPLYLMVLFRYSEDTEEIWKLELMFLSSRLLANPGFGHSGTPSPPLPSPLSLPRSFSPRSPPSFPFREGPTPKPARGLVSTVSSPSGIWGKTPGDKLFWCISEPKRAALVATVFVHFHKNKFKFLYKHKTA